ncbi:uncharacterized protein LOC123302148 isoform X2 [Chrysoperla carnea]|uniref:uncharacterized protein LOC123302148 isoform X2 n=1 Tax=Chrysoperla carnea TaxID=189513 RepID=UPI001D0911BA|nr:uncharacterized protein LOC123302148 isoform X2 [Chrysoperla carnea]
MSTNYSSSLVPNCIQQSQSPVHQNNDIQRNTNRTPVNTTNHSPGGNSNNTTTTSQTKSNQQLKSPVAKRPANASVTLQGWLHKQGSDGLQLWRKRWFVLSELCLYYYKSTEEDKLLGSVLLPSYRVSECRPEDKVVRKFAFKLEHANMRTYLLAADSHKSMLQWVCALNLACMLQLPINNPQKNIESPATPQQQSHNSQKIQNNQKQQSTTGASASTPNHFQPLYENAPPKPRRVSESVRYMDPQQYGMDYPHQKYSHIIYANQHIDPRMQHHMTTSPSPQQQQYQHVIAEQRRTPDTYGRSMSMSHYDHGMVGMRAVGIQQKIHHPDYEDVYNVKSDLYEPPRSPLAYNHIKNDCPNLQSMRQFQQPPRNYRPINIEPSYRPHNMEYRRQPVREVISRPHSVDFLEHNNSDYNQKTQPERPKSSLDINQYNDENDFYSEQDYANKMRQSSIYLQYRPIKPNEFKSPTPMAPVDMNQWYRQQQQHQHAQQQHAQQQVQQDIYEQRHEQRPHAAYLHPNTSSLHRDPQLQHHYMQHAAAVARDQMEHVYGTSPHHMSAPQYGSMGHPIRSRSKSPQVRIRQQTNMGSESMPSVETEKKREESMKRLIEWKQRMLQSPLNHKQKSRRKCHEMQRYESESPSNSEHINSITQHRSSINNSIGSGVIASSTPTNTASRYHNHRPIPLASASSVPNTSYSSDDEDTERSGSVDAQAGRTQQVYTTADSNDVSMATTTISVSATDDITDTDDQPKQDESKNSDLKSEEQHYMIMVPKKSILAPNSSHSGAVALFESLSCESEESSYVEMMQTLGPSILNTESTEINDTTNLNSDMQTYETVCFDDKSATEPVYMELSMNNDSKDSNLFIPSNYQTLPDILISSEKQKSSKSDSSDADDEASKDFNSLDAPTQPRFSLSDTFRPASYYLGVNRVLAEFHDSSDSELVSPPPIPPNSSPLLLDDLEGEELTSDKKKSDFVQLRKLNTKLINTHFRSYSAIDPSYSSKSISEFDNINKRRPVSSDFCTKLDRELFNRDNIYTPMMPYNELYETENIYENISVVKQKVDVLRTEKAESLSESLCSSTNFINSSFDTTSSNISQFGAQDCSKSGLEDSSQSSDTIISQLSNDYYLFELLRSNTSDSSTKNLSLNNDMITDSKLDKQLQKADMFQIALATNKPETIDITKGGKINNKNIYMDDPENWNKDNTEVVRRSYSLEGLLQNVLKDNQKGYAKNINEIKKDVPEEITNEGDRLWEEDGVWQENLRRASHRHARSLDDLQTVTTVTSHKKLTRDVTYVNDYVTSTLKDKDVKNRSNKSFIIDREKLRQWDLMSSAPVLSRSGGNNTGAQQLGVPSNMSLTEDKLVADIENDNIEKPNSDQNSASGSVSIVSGHDGQSMEHPQSAWLLQPDQGRRTPIRSIPSTSTYQIASPQFYDENDRYPCRAGSLPRNSHYAAQNKRRQSYQKYEKNKPLVNLVDNMVKLGSLYQKNGNSRNEKLNGARNRERLQFNQQVQERRLLAEEKRDWKKINLNHAQLQSKIQQLYELDNALRHESGTLAGLRKEKEYLEGALQSLQNKLTDSELPSTPPAELDRVRRHQQLLERELSRVHVLLAYNSKKLEETVAGNARIEQELLVLRQKLQMTQRQRKQPYLSNTIPKERKSLAESAPEMESELKRVQWLMGDLQKQRQELSVQVRHLTDKSQNLAHQMQWPISNNTSIDNTNDLEASTSSLRSSSARSHSPSSLKRTQWLETDLDICSENKPQNYLHNSDDGLFSTDLSENPQSNLYEKQEIKTVRIVKRESERRHRDRERTGIGSTLSLAIPPARLATMGTGSGGASSMSMGSLKQRDHGISSNDLASHYYKDEDLEQSSNISSHVLSKSTDSLATYNKKPCGNPLSPPLQTASLGRRIVPKEKRRHHTAPDNNHISRDLSLLSASDGDTSSWLKSERSLDDLDMERALRPRINTPDVVRSTLGHKEIKYNERTIDNILGTPSKIIIPERYMPQDLPELSAEEERQRMRKVESIKKMLSDSTALPTTLDTSRLGQGTEGKSFTMSEEKRQREHLLQLNQILAKQVIEMSKIVAEKALNSLPQIPAPPLDEDELSPITPLPLYQQRENFYS